MKNWKIICLILPLLFDVYLVNAQAKKKKLPRSINMLGYENFGPAISGDGNSMVYMSNYTNEGNTAWMFTEKESASSWKDPEELPRIINIPHLTYLHGYCLNFDGSEFYFTFKKSGGIGGFDIWMAKREGNNWKAVQNLGLPLNSSMHDGSPSISSDGKALYFMSCETMTNDRASQCKLMVSTRRNKASKWGKPAPLPGSINQSNTLSPKILADKETLMYLSDHEGELQWYLSRMQENVWLEPQKMDFIEVNGLRNISLTAKGRYVFHDVPGDRGSTIEQKLIPEAFRPKDILRITGMVNSTEGGGGTMKVYDINTKERKVFETLDDGDNFDFLLKEGHVYDVSFETNNSKIPAISEIFDLTEIKYSRKKKWTVNPQILNTGDSIALKPIHFDTLSLSIADQSFYALRRLLRFLDRNQGEYEVNIFHYTLDTSTISEWMIQLDTASNTMHSPLKTEIMVMDSSQVTVDTVAFADSPEIIAPTMAENLAAILLEKLMENNISEDQCQVNGITVWLKKLEGNEELMDQIFVYLKKK